MSDTAIPVSWNDQFLAHSPRPSPTSQPRYGIQIAPTVSANSAAASRPYVRAMDAGWNVVGARAPAGYSPVSDSGRPSRADLVARRVRSQVIGPDRVIRRPSTRVPRSGATTPTAVTPVGWSGGPYGSADGGNKAVATVGVPPATAPPPVSRSDPVAGRVRSSGSAGRTTGAD